MVYTRKFSQFVPENVDEVVGLTNGANAIGPNGGGGGGQGVTTTITQPNTLALGEWVTIDLAGNYIPALGDNAQDAEVVGVVVEIIVPNQEFVVQQSGYITTAQNPFATLIGALIPGNPYFLSTTNAGLMTTADATVTDTVSRSVFYADTPTSGWVLPYRGLIVGGFGASSSAGSTTDSNITTVTQTGHGFMVGQWLRVTTPSGGQANYTLAIATTLANAQSVGVVIAETTNTFTIQFAGYNTGAVAGTYVDGGAGALVPATAYYLSTITAGNISSVNPYGTSDPSKPLYICEQTTATTGVNTGWVLPQRPLIEEGASNPNVILVTQPGNTFEVGDWVYVSGAGPVYSLAIGTSLATSQVSGVVTAVPPTTAANTFMLQFSGYNIGAVHNSGISSGGGVATPVVPATLYYLSVTQAGAMQPTAPTVLGQFTKPVYQCEQTEIGAGSTLQYSGYILPQRPLIISPSGGGGTGWTLLQSYVLNNQMVGVDTGGAFLDGTYQDIEIRGENIIVDYVPAPGSFSCTGQYVRFYTGGILRTANYMQTPGGGTYFEFFGNNGNSLMYTQGNLNQFFTILVQGVSYSTNYKSPLCECYFKSQFSNIYTYNERPVGLGGGISAPPGGVGAAPSYNGDPLPITGFVISQQPNYIFVSGTISIYGRTFP